MILAYLIGGLMLVTGTGSAAPRFEDQTVVPEPVGQWGYRGMPGDIVALQDQSLLLCYTSQQGKGIVGRTSSDLGRTWGDEFVLAANPAAVQGYYCHPSFARLPNGDLLLSYIMGTPALPYYGHNYYRRSTDEGRTWSDQFCMTPGPGYVIMHNDKLRVLSTGRLIAPCERKKRWPSSNDHGGYVANSYYSDDNGVSWYPSASEVDMDPAEAQEAHICELRNGTLLMVFRTYNGFLGRAYSPDWGVSWSQGEFVRELPISANACAVSVERIPTTGDLLLVRTTGGEGGRRNPLTACISQDEGETWSAPKSIAAGPEDDFGYQSIDFVGDLCLISYHARDGLHVARIGVDWFYAP